MLVGDENSAQVLRSPPDTEESLADLPGTEAGIDEQPGILGLKVGTVATGTAGEDGQARRHGATLKTVRCQRKLKSSETADEVWNARPSSLSEASLRIGTDYGKAIYVPIFP